jgi:sugar/nucleoside kinase (ribokinase family)
MGSLALDSIETPSGSVENEPGGSALFASVAASLFTGVRIVATVGKDFPEGLLATLGKRGIDTQGVVVEEGETFKWGGIYESNMNKRRSVFTRLGVFERFDPLLPDDFRDSRHVFLANIDPDVQLRVLRQISSPDFVLCDTMNFWIAGKRSSLLELAKHVDVLLMNDEEALELSGETGILRAGRWLLAIGPRYVVVKKGEHGALLFGPEGVFSAPCFPVYDVVDPTGAGDTFAGAMLGYLSQCEKADFAALKQAVIHGSVVASFCIEGFGARKLLSLERTAFEKRLAEFLSMIRVA